MIIIRYLNFFFKDVGLKVVLNLCEPFFETKRCVTADNFFSSIRLANALNEKKITFIGTLRTNKAEIPEQFLANKARKVDTSIFGFKDDLTLVSYVPKFNKLCIIFLTNLFSLFWIKSQI
jgi:hypothetical protein